MSTDPTFSVRPKYDQLIELLDTLVNWQKFGTFLPRIKSEDIQVIERDNRGTDKQKATLFSKWLCLSRGFLAGCHVSTRKVTRISSSVISISKTQYIFLKT